MPYSKAICITIRLPLIHLHTTALQANQFFQVQCCFIEFTPTHNTRKHSLSHLHSQAAHSTMLVRKLFQHQNLTFIIVCMV